MKKNIKDINDNKLKEFLANTGEPQYRFNQIQRAIYKNKVADFTNISNIPKSLINKLNDNYVINSINIKESHYSNDGSIKFIFSSEDNNLIEAVYMPWYDENGTEKMRQTLCISSQVGCGLNCSFCATGKMGLKRNLKVSEIIEQVFVVEKYLDTKITNIVFMGMGEPLQNFQELEKSLEILTNPEFELISRRHITISTVGIVPKIRELAKIEKPTKLAISLHAAIDKKRSQIIPLNEKYPIKELMDAVEFYYRITKMPITYEYILFDNFNETEEDIKALAHIARRVPSRVNLITFNDISFALQNDNDRLSLRPANKEKIESFAQKLRNEKVPVLIRNTFGSDIEAACGQLALISGNRLVNI
ncbi:MAG TPA: 23S rRNA (adenine(2503)-C(2))-methyltransferase RlmN [Candidatus Kapabacteria bacterium]|nr:23S rRNA (adenine(2503)-C(2))-methyltransferase RlmN [Candidatus Kapabacteria bacterium]